MNGTSFPIHAALYMPNVHGHEEVIEALRTAGFTSWHEYGPSRPLNERSVTILPSAGVSLDDLRDAVNAAAAGYELPPLPEAARQ